MINEQIRQNKSVEWDPCKLISDNRENRIEKRVCNFIINKKNKL
jgi:hypothetical protein